MIRSLTLKNFRRHRELDLVLSPGLNVLRGANESGKSTILEGVLYALYGAKALRSPLAETVTWGCKEHELSVTLQIVVDGKPYTFTRSKGGAECNYEGGKVVGQNEVSAFAAQLLGADVKTAAALMMASQSGLRGALDEGPAAVSALMARLADFDLIDRIIERMQATRTLGPDAPLRGKIETAEAEVELANDAFPAADELPLAEERINACETALRAAEKQRDELTGPSMNEALAAYTQAQSIAKQYQELTDQNSVDWKVVNDLVLRDEIDQTLVAARPAPEAIQQAREALQAANSVEQARQRYLKVAGLPAYPETFWEGTEQEFNDFLEKQQANRHALVGEIQRLSGEVGALSRSKITSGKCPTCGRQDMADEHVKSHNDQIDTKVAELNKLIADSRAVVVNVDEDIQALSTLKRTAQPFVEVASFVTAHTLPVDIDTNVHPPRLNWTGPVPPEKVDVGALRKTVTQLEEAQSAAAQAEGRISARQEQVARLHDAIKLRVEQIQALPSCDLVALHNDYEAAAAVHTAQIAVVATAQAELAEWVEHRRGIVEREQQARARLDAAVKRLEEYQADLKTLAFNNALMKKLKTLKPAITDYLWNSVLAAVSNFFSTMRGEQSIVTKEGAGFRVNGQSVDSLSGSTLDVLALAIRVALTRTFIPNAGFITLDEPAYGCDSQRTGNVLGFLATAGFHQTLLASHDELSEAVADNLITLET